MPESEKIERKTCEYEWNDLKSRAKKKCGRLLFDDEHCIFHSKNRKGKKEKFMGEFGKLLANKEKDFVGFIFPEKADLRFFDLQQANLEKADLRGASLYMAGLQGSNLSYTNFQRAILFGAYLDGAYLFGTDLRGANLGNTSFEKAKVSNVKYNRSTQCLGIDVTHIKGSQIFVRFAKDQDYLEEMRTTAWGRVKYSFWNVLADCGRSIWGWALWSFFLAFVFAIKFFSLGPDAFTTHEPLGHSFDTMLYYSVVTFTTLGFGDIIPNTVEASRWVMAEVILGYVMLGGLISILANKIARRS
jgi:uncharacterized protein YjbI with pentapeptide repeats